MIQIIARDAIYHKICKNRPFPEVQSGKASSTFGKVRINFATEPFHVCGIRFSRIKPSKWKDEYDLSDYLYFEVIPVKEMNFDFE